MLVPAMTTTRLNDDSVAAVAPFYHGIFILLSSPLNSTHIPSPEIDFVRHIHD